VGGETIAVEKDNEATREKSESENNGWEYMRAVEGHFMYIHPAGTCKVGIKEVEHRSR
jgi:hypothetical protein